RDRIVTGVQTCALPIYRCRVKYVVMDMNAFYPYAIKEIFPNAEIIIDRFHIVHQLNRALNNKRIHVMKEQKNKESRHYTKLKRRSEERRVGKEWNTREQ